MMRALLLAGFVLGAQAFSPSAPLLSTSTAPASLYAPWKQGRAMIPLPAVSRVSMDSEGPSGQLVDGKYDAQRFFVRQDRLGDMIRASAPFALRLGSGALTYGWSFGLAKDEPEKYALFRSAGYMTAESTKVDQFPRPAKPIQLYEFENCPFCRKVREAAAILDLDIEYYPCPKGSPNFRPKVVEMGGKAQFPYMIDPNTGTEMYESMDIIKYLFTNYGPGEDAPIPILLQGPLSIITAGLGQVIAGGAFGYQPSRLPEKPLIVWGYEASPFSKVVRQELSGREIPHVWKSAARGSPKRQELFEKTGTFQVPFLEDPNTGVAMYESAEIVDYVRETYGNAPASTSAEKETVA